MSGRSDASAPIFSNEVAGMLNGANEGPPNLEPINTLSGNVDRVRLVRKGNGSFNAVTIDVLSKPRIHANRRPGKIASFAASTPEAILRDAFAYGEVYEKASDKQIQEAAAKAAGNAGFSSSQARYLARAVLALLVVRNGMATPTALETV